MANITENDKFREKLVVFWQGHKDLFASSPRAKIEDRLGRALGGDARPRRIYGLQVLVLYSGQQKTTPKGVVSLSKNPCFRYAKTGVL